MKLTEQKPAADRILITYCAICLILFICYASALLPYNFLIKVASAFFFLSSFLLIFLNHKPLRNGLIYCIWLTVSIAQVGLSIILKGKPEFAASNIIVIGTLRGLFVYLVLYQVFRQCYLLYHKKELELGQKSTDTSIDILATPVIMMSVIIVIAAA